MAGFFGLFNYEKEGPGIRKNGPKKKTIIVFFETFFRNFWKFISINLVFILLSLPILTSGLAAVGITHVTRNIARDKHSFGLSDFFETIKKNWKQGLLAGIINTLILILLAFDLYFFSYGTEGMMPTIGLGICVCILFVFVVMNFYIWTLIITFRFSLKQVYRNSFKFVFLNMKMNLLCLGSLLLTYGLYVAVLLLLQFNIVLALEILIALFTLPAFRYLLIQFFIFPSVKKYIIDPYYAAHPDDDIEQRRDLGIEIEKESQSAEEGQEDETQEDDDGPVFED